MQIQEVCSSQGLVSTIRGWRETVSRKCVLAKGLLLPEEEDGEKQCSVNSKPGYLRKRRTHRR